MTIKILADASLPGVSDLFSAPFEVTYYYHNQQVTDLLTDHVVLLCRSTLKITEHDFKNNQLAYIATASSGTDHIDINFLQKHPITLLDAKGCNATAVADYVIASLAYLDQHQPIKGQLAGVIGIGEVGGRVAERLKAIGYEVLCYDPYREKQDQQFNYQSLSALATCDLICVHPKLHATPPFPSKNLINAAFLKQLKPYTTLINASRGGIVDELSLRTLKNPVVYCTDVYENEPSIDSSVIDFALLCTPHIAGHSIEAKNNAVKMLYMQLCQRYHLPCPEPLSKTIQTINFPVVKNHHWADYILALYNPGYETAELKQADDLSKTFLKCRAAHQKRHDFCVYKQEILNFLTKYTLDRGFFS